MCPDFTVTSCREKLQKNFVIKQVKLKSFGKKKSTYEPSRFYSLVGSLVFFARRLLI